MIDCCIGQRAQSAGRRAKGKVLRVKGAGQRAQGEGLRAQGTSKPARLCTSLCSDSCMSVLPPVFCLLSSSPFKYHIVLGKKLVE